MSVATNPLPAWNGTGPRRILALALLAVLLAVVGSHAQETPEAVGRIEGDDIAVKGQVSLRREGSRSTAALSSGSEVTVRSGQARLELDEGGEVDICGPAQFTVLKNGGAVTLALHDGRLHLRLSPTLPFTVYSALIIATPLSVGGEPRDQVIGLDAAGALCAFSLRGAVRFQQQLSGAILVLPEAGEVALPDGRFESLREGGANCRCDVVLAGDVPQKPKQPEAGLANSGDKNNAPEVKEEAKAPVREDPRWTVIMPPLTFDASSPSPPPEPNSAAPLLHRETGGRPEVATPGQVPEASPQKNAAAETHSGAEQKPAAAQKGGFLGRVKHFFRRIFGGKRKT